MAYKFKIVADLYVSPDGDDLNDGSTPALSVATIARLRQLTLALTTGTYTVAVASGHYIGAVTGDFTAAISISLTIVADGYVVLSGDNTHAFNPETPTTFSGENVIFQGFQIERFSSYNHLRSIRFNDCRFDGSSFMGVSGASGGSFTYSEQDTVFDIPVNFNQVTASTNALNLTRCLISKNVNISAALLSLTDSHVSVDSIITFISLASNKYPRLFNCNFNGVLNLEGADFAIQDELVGTPQDNGYSAGVEWLTESNMISAGVDSGIAASIVSFSTATNKQISFNSIDSNNLTMNRSSFGLSVGTSGGDSQNISGQYLSKDLTVENSTFLIESSTNVVISGDQYIVSGGTVGTITLEPIFIANGLSVIPAKLQSFFEHAFSIQFGSGTANNSNVLSVTNDKEVGLTLEARWTNVANNPPSLPTADLEYENGGLVTAGDYTVFQIGGAYEIDSLGRGDGDPNFDVATRTTPPMVAIQYRITMRNDY